MINIMIIITFFSGFFIGVIWHIYCTYSKKKLENLKKNDHKRVLNTKQNWYGEPKMELDVGERWYKALLNGTKKCEGRKMSPTYAHLKEIDIISITYDDGVEIHKFDAIITKINKYPGNKNNDGLTDYLLTEGIENCLPGVKTLEEAQNIYLKWSTIKEIKQYGMMAIHIRVLER